MKKMNTLLRAALAAVCVALLTVMPVAQAATVTYTMQTGNFNASQGSGGNFHGFYNNNASEIGVYANTASDSSYAAFQTFTTTGVGSGTARALQPGDTFTLTGFISANPPSRIGLAFRSSTTYTSFSQIDTADEAKFQLDSSGGWKIYNSGSAIDSGNGAGADATLTIKVTSAKTFNATVVRSGSTFNTYDVPMITGAGASISSFGVFAVNSGNDTFWKNGSLADSGTVEFGVGNGSSLVSGLITDGLAANSTSSVRTNALIKTGTGTITLSNSANSYSGGTTISNGTLAISSDGNLGATSGGLTIVGGTSSSLQISSSLTLNAARTVTIGASGGKLDAQANTLTIAGNIANGSGTNHLYILADGNTTINGSISGSGDIVKQGLGVLTLNGTNNTFGSTATNNIFFDKGTIQGASSGAFGVTNGWINIGSSVDSTAGDALLQLTAGGATVLNNLDSRYYTAVTTANVKTIGGNNASGTATFSGNIALHDKLTIAAASGGTVVVTGPIATGGGIATGQSTNTGNVLFSAGPGITKTGAGTLEFSGNNTFSGETYVKAGTLQFNSSTVTYGNSTIRLGDDVASSTATLNIANVSGGGTVNGLVNTRAGAGGTKTLASANTSGVNTYGGAMAFDADTTISSANSGGTLAFTNASFDIKNHALTVTGSGDTTISSPVTNSTTGGSLTKTGSGKLTLSGNNNFSGVTTVNNGMVLIHGNHGLSAVTVASGATLGGNGRANSTTIQTGATLSPGASVGKITLTNLTLAANSTNLFEFDVAGATNDSIAVVNNLTNSGGNVTVSISGGTLAVGSYTILTYGGTKSGTFGSVSVTGSAAGTVSVDESTSGQINLLVRGTTTNTVTSSHNPSAKNESVSFTATITGGASAPTGTVQFKTNGVAFGSAVTLSGGSGSSAVTTTLPRGTNTVTAEYSGSTIYFSSTNTLNQVVTNTPPVARTDSYGRANNLQFKIKISDLLTNDSDLDGDPITFTGANLSSTNSVTVTTNGSYIFYPSNAPNANDQLSYTISDGFGGTATGLVNITVSGGQTGQTNALVALSNNVATVTFFGVPGTAYQAQRATNVNFTGTIRSWSTNAPSGGAFGVFEISDDFSDVGGPPAPSQSYYRLVTP